MGRQRKQLKGRKFGFLEVLDFDSVDCRGYVRWRCKCMLCGKETVVKAADLTGAKTRSCGCLASNKKYPGIKKHWGQYCNFYPDTPNDNGCEILTERLCETEGRCGFFKGGFYGET